MTLRPSQLQLMSIPILWIRNRKAKQLMKVKLRVKKRKVEDRLERVMSRRSTKRRPPRHRSLLPKSLQLTRLKLHR